MKPKHPPIRDKKPKEAEGKYNDPVKELTVIPFDGTIYRAAMNFDQDIFLYGFCARDKSGNRIDPTSIRMKTDGTYVIIKGL